MTTPVELAEILSMTPKLIMEANDAACNSLWTADQLNRAHCGPYYAPDPTVAPQEWQASSPRPADQKTYSSRIELMYPELASILPIENVVLAGPSAGSVFIDQGQDGAYADLYIIGLSSEPRGVLWAKVHEIATKLRAALRVSGLPLVDPRTNVQANEPQTRSEPTGEEKDPHSVHGPGTSIVPIPESQETVMHVQDEPLAIESVPSGDAVPRIGVTVIGSQEQEAQIAQLFMAGLSPEQVVEQLRSLDAGDQSAHLIPNIETMRAGAITIYGGKHALKYRIILRAFESLHSLLHKFSVPTACVAYDGSTTFLTSLGAYAYAHRVNIVWPAYHTTTYVANLWADFNRRGFAITMPHLSPSALEQKTIVLRDLVIVPEKISGNFGTGSLRLINLEEPFDDYVEPDPAMRDCVESTYDVAEKVRRSNLLAVSTEKSCYILAGINLNLAAFITEPEPQFGDMFPLAAFESSLQEMLQIVMQGQSVVLATSVMNAVLRMTPENIGRFVAAWVKTGLQNPGRGLNAAPAFAPFIRALMERYQTMCSRPTVWWLSGDTVVRDGVQPIDPQKWYNGLAVQGSSGEQSPDTVIRTLRGLLVHRATSSDKTIFGTECALCHQEVRIGGIDTLILGCGHAFHWSNKNCPGFVRWAALHGTCPVCRVEFNEKEEQAPPPVDIAINWEEQFEGMSVNQAEAHVASMVAAASQL